MNSQNISTSDYPPCICARCGLRIAHADHPVEWQESFSVRFRGGYGSIFGDGNVVDGDFCQRCIREVLGPYLRVREDDPIHPAIKFEGQARRIDQPNMRQPDLPPIPQEELLSLFPQFRPNQERN